MYQQIVTTLSLTSLSFQKHQKHEFSSPNVCDKIIDVRRTMPTDC